MVRTMIYLIYGLKDFVIKKHIKAIKDKFNEESINNYDLNITDIKDIIDDANTISLFSDQKLIICDNSTIFTAAAKASNILESYLENPNENTTIIFALNQEKIDSRKKSVKTIKKIGKIIECNENINPTEFIKKEFNNYQINNKEINLLRDRVGDNLDLLSHEIEKIKIYKDNDKIITEEDIINLTHKNIEINIFTLIDYIISNNKDKALEIYYEMLKQNEEPIKIIVILANQFRIMYQSKELLKRGLSEKDIADTLKVHPYRVKLALQNSRKYDSKMLLSYLNDLANMDLDIKSGKINKDLALELFILKK